MTGPRGQAGRRAAGGQGGPDPSRAQLRPVGEHEYDPADDMVIRPFLLTGGRTRPVQEGLRVETLVHARPRSATAVLRFEHQQIVQLCREPTSLAEISAALRVPFGVARVLVSDLVADGSVVVTEREELSIQLIERIRDRVRAL
ncbi:DUF742 domain-containing protein [Kineosporia babensis]|uniref:DUF742 domain-containing protein n=1 Tax=Kineosporia babensis TaxID=499548 RepID=A0A9X1NF80_9ACTN|nr:DUF742 domain-containing protein [Kineosporia babensis]MCD5312216.1 DUF742 domain-containing protein [Kineosporia babensis]